jgi:hypothetical protein
MSRPTETKKTETSLALAQHNHFQRSIHHQETCTNNQEHDDNTKGVKKLIKCPSQELLKTLQHNPLTTADA